jgi:hypothetical protein
VYSFWLFVHLGGLLMFVAGHGASATAGMRLRRERDPARMGALLDASAATRVMTYAGLVLLGIGGIADAFLGHFWSEGWIWASIVVFVAMTVILIGLAIPYYHRLRLAVAHAASRGDPGQIERISASPTPLLILVVGVVGLGVILWLMVCKPF